jgi:hypothetical protein
MRPARLTTKFTASALGLALGAAVLVIPAPARAADDDAPADTKFLRSILEGLGLQRDGGGINYQERPPLVIPSTRTLPPPEKSDAVTANNPAWPNDPDVQRAKAEADQEKSKLFTSAGEQIEHDQRPLRPNEMTPGPKPRSARKTASSGSSQAPKSEYGDVLSPSQLGTKGAGLLGNIFGSKEEESAKFTGEPPRASLTEPPPGYQTPSPDQPYGVGKEKPVAAKPGSYQEGHPTSGL